MDARFRRHLALAGQPRAVAERLLVAYEGSSGALDPVWLSRYAATEVMRRLIGVAQLPLSASAQRCQLLERSRQVMTGNAIGDLF